MSEHAPVGRHLVIGADGGLGAATVRALQDAGAQVTTLNRSDVDLRTSGELDSALQRVWSEHGPFDGLIHCAGIFPAHPAMQASEALFDEVLAVNARSALISATRMAQLAITVGRSLDIVLISSGAARSARPGTITYAASKAALEAVVRGLALELNRDGVRVNAVAPGFVDVHSATNPVPDRYIAELQAASPRGRVATPADIVPVITWLLTPASAWITGQTIAVDGGASLGSPDAPNWMG